MFRTTNPANSQTKTTKKQLPSQDNYFLDPKNLFALGSYVHGQKKPRRKRLITPDNSEFSETF